MEADLGSVGLVASYPPRFDIRTQKTQMLAYLEEHGYAVVASVADDEAVEKAKSLMWDYLEALPNTNVRRDDVSTWGQRADWFPHPGHGIIGGFGFGHSEFMWHLRLLPKVKEAFAAIWGTDDLLVSFDGGNAFRPWRYDPTWLTMGGWFHCDQNGTKPGSRGKVCVQGLVTLLDATEETGGLVVIPGSHKQHDALCSRVRLAKLLGGDFFPVPVDDPILDSAATLVCAKAGDLVLWDSRTVHCNTPALTASMPMPRNSGQQQMGEGSQAPEENILPPLDPEGHPWRLIRQVGYVCMTPTSLATKDVLLKRQKAFVENVSTSHWPHKHHPAGAALLGTPDNDPTTISKEQRALIGYDREGDSSRSSVDENWCMPCSLYRWARMPRKS